MWAARRGAALLIPSGPSRDPGRMHLHIVLTDPVAATGEVIIVCVCSIPLTNLYDGSCTLFPDEHPFINKHSYVDYHRCKVIASTLLEEKVASKEFVAKDPLDPKRFDDVLVGFADSPQVAPKIRRFFAAAA